MGLQRLQVLLAKVAAVQRAGLGYSHLGHGNRSQRGGDLDIVVGMGRQGVADNQQRVLVHGRLGIVVLVKAFVIAVLHHPTVGVGEVVLVPVLGTRRRRRGRL